MIINMADTEDILTLRVGDIDGDFRDDVVIGTATGWIRWMRKLTNLGTTWDTTRVVLSIDKRIYDLDIGDVDRGVIIDLSR